MNPSIIAGKGKGTQAKTLKWERDNVTDFKNKVWYVTVITTVLERPRQSIWLMFGDGIGSICVATPASVPLRTNKLKRTVQVKN